MIKELQENVTELAAGGFDKITAESLITAPPAPTQDQLIRDCGYHQAQHLLETMLGEGLISKEEFNKITALNRESFSPYLVELFPELT